MSNITGSDEYKPPPVSRRKKRGRGLNQLDTDEESNGAESEEYRASE